MTLWHSTKRPKRGALALLCIFVLAVGGHAVSDISPVEEAEGRTTDTGSLLDNEYRIKALFIYRIIRWVTWPKQALPAKSKTIVVGVVGKDPFGKNLDLLSKLKPIKKRKIVVKRFKNLSDIRKTQVLFVSSSLSDAEVTRVVDLARRNSILLVGEKKKFADQGGMINLLIVNKKIAFEANPNAVKAAKMKISSQILKMAARIVKKK